MDSAFDAAGWKFSAAHASSDSTTGASPAPRSVSEYSTLTGFSSTTVRSTSPFSSRSSRLA
jgi:hypothetical protein